MENDNGTKTVSDDNNPAAIQQQQQKTLTRSLMLVTCNICYKDGIPQSEMCSSIVSSCTHGNTICKSCMVEWIKVTVETAATTTISQLTNQNLLVGCPFCIIPLSIDDIQKIMGTSFPSRTSQIAITNSEWIIFDDDDDDSVNNDHEFSSDHPNSHHGSDQSLLNSLEHWWGLGTRNNISVPTAASDLDSSSQDTISEEEEEEEELDDASSGGDSDEYLSNDDDDDDDDEEEEEESDESSASFFSLTIDSLDLDDGIASASFESESDYGSNSTKSSSPSLDDDDDVYSSSFSSEAELEYDSDDDSEDGDGGGGRGGGEHAHHAHHVRLLIP